MSFQDINLIVSDGLVSRMHKNLETMRKVHYKIHFVHFMFQKNAYFLNRKIFLKMSWR